MKLQNVLRRVACLFASCRPDTPSSDERKQLIHDMHEIPQRIDRLIERQQRNPVERTVWPGNQRRSEHP